jgi:hypothetical protein
MAKTTDSEGRQRNRTPQGKKEMTTPMTQGPNPYVLTDLLTKRPVRSRDCPTCGGHGRVDDSYSLVSIEGPLPGAPGGAISTCVVGSSSIFKAAREAREIAESHDRPVAFDFIGDLVVVLRSDDPEQVARAWWIGHYGETPEQTAARR